MIYLYYTLFEMKYHKNELSFGEVMSHAKVSQLKENDSLVRLNDMTHAKDRRRYR